MVLCNNDHKKQKKETHTQKNRKTRKWGLNALYGLKPEVVKGTAIKHTELLHGPSVCNR